MSGKPLPVQRPRPVTLNAGFSPPGRDFAARAADCLFTTFVEIGSSGAQIDDMRRRAAATGREVGVYTTCHVVCRPIAGRGRGYYEHYAVEMEDTAGADHYMGNKAKFSGSHDPEAYRLHRKRFVGGAGTVSAGRHAAATSPRSWWRSVEVGFAGVALSFVNYQGRAAVFHRDSAAAAARGWAAQAS